MKKKRVYAVVKRIFDIISSLLALIVLSPLFLITAIAIKIDSKGPVFFRQKRVGKNKKLFNILKFRSMRTDTDPNAPTHQLKAAESHITKVGKFIRKTSIDELPQLINILLGQMSVVGPRPALFNQYDLIEERDKYHANDITPGLTGLAQISGRDELEIPVKARIDGEYVTKRGVFFDLGIIFKTVFKVFERDGVVEGGTGELFYHQKRAFMTMDVEDWYHTGYILDGGYEVDKSYTMLDGVGGYIDLLNAAGVKGTFFVVAELLERTPGLISVIKGGGMDIGLHGLTHKSPVNIETDEFTRQISLAKTMLEEATKKKVYSYRAPSYAIDDERFKIIRNLGFKLDSSHINSKMNSRYVRFSLDGFERVGDQVLLDGDFTEVEPSTQRFLKKNFPLGGGAFRILPWFFVRFLIKKYLKRHNVFVFFIHPYEVSAKKCPKVKGLKLKNKIRFTYGRGSVRKKIEKTIKLLKRHGFEFSVMNEMVEKALISGEVASSAQAEQVV